MDALLADTAERIFRDHCDKALLDAAEAGTFPEALWGVLVETGLHQVGGAASGTGLADLFGLLQVAGRHAVPLPLAETLLVNRLCDVDGARPDGRVGSFAGAKLLATIATDGVAPWGRHAGAVLHAETGRVVTDFGHATGSNLAGEPRDRIEGGRQASAATDVADLTALLALSRVALMAGALTRVLELAIGYAMERHQFGRPLSKFQAIQHNLAVLAGETAAAQRAADGAIDALSTPRFPDQVAAAKSRVGEAAGVAAEIAHQVHGAMGFTHEHTLHHFTRRLWAWRDEHGAESLWQARLGRRIAAGGADAVWEFLTSADR